MFWVSAQIRRPKSDTDLYFGLYYPLDITLFFAGHYLMSGANIQD